MFDLGVLLFILMFQNIPFQRAHESDPRYRLVMEGKFNEFFIANGADKMKLHLDGLNAIWCLVNIKPHHRTNITSLMNFPFVRLGSGETMMLTDELREEILSIINA